MVAVHMYSNHDNLQTLFTCIMHSNDAAGVAVLAHLTSFTSIKSACKLSALSRGCNRFRSSKVYRVLFLTVLSFPIYFRKGVKCLIPQQEIYSFIRGNEQKDTE